MIRVLIVPVPGHCLLVAFVPKHLYRFVIHSYHYLQYATSVIQYKGTPYKVDLKSWPIPMHKQAILSNLTKYNVQTKCQTKIQKNQNYAVN